VRHAAQLPISGIKFHALYVMRDAPLAAWYAEGRYTPLTFADYLRVLGRALPLIPREVVVHRLASDCRRDLLVAPDWCWDRSRIRREILDYLTAQQCVQGSACD
jgi:radical SAM superfamily enzyme